MYVEKIRVWGKGAAPPAAGVVVALLRVLRRQIVADVCAVIVAAVWLHFVLPQTVFADYMLYSGCCLNGLAPEGWIAHHLPDTKTFCGVPLQMGG